MKSSSSAIWVVLAAIGLGLFLLVDPASWFAGEAEVVTLDHPGSSAPAQDDAPAVELVDGVDAPGDTDSTRTAETIEREEVDPLVESGIASLRVLDPAARPVVDAQVLVVRGGELLADERTDVEGEVVLPADAKPAGLVVAVPRRPLEWHDVVLDAGRQDIHLIEGRRLSGRFVLEGDRSPGSLRIGLDSDRSPTSIPDLPASVEDALTVQTLRSAYVVFDTGEEGAFELTGLPESWSGRILLRGDWKVVSSTQGELDSARGIRFTAPAADVVVRVARPRALRGRLVLRGDGTPLADAQVCALLRSPDAESPTFASARTDVNGRFEIRSRQARLAELDLRLGLTFRESPSLLRLGGAELPTDGDLGDVIVDAVRHVPFLLLDPRGAPITGGAAVAAGVRSEPTGSDGRGELRWIAGAVDRLVAEAPGFVPRAAEIPAVLVHPLVVTLEPANGLVVRLLLPQGSDPTQFRVLLFSDERITASPVASAADQRRHVSRKAIHLMDYTGAAPDTYLCAGVDADTKSASFHALRPGLEIALEIQGITGQNVYHAEPVAPLAPAEQRELEVSLQVGMIAFRGRVVDLDGNALAFAKVQLGGQILGWTDGGGAFECFLPGPETGTLLLQHQACTTKYLHDFAVPADGNPVEFRLSPARRLEIEVVDEDGTAMPRAEIYTEYGGFTTNTHRIGGHRHYSSSMPEGAFVIRTQLAGRVYRQDHDPALSEARVVVPVHGSVVAHIDGATTATSAGRFILVLAPPADEEAMPLVESRDSAPDLRIEARPVHPGTYQASLQYEPTAAEAEAGRGSEESAPVSVTVAPGKESEVRLALPNGDG